MSTPAPIGGRETLVVSHGFEPNYVVGFARGLVANGVPVTVLSSNGLGTALDAASIGHVNLRGSDDPARSRLAKVIGYLRYLARLLWAVLRHRGRPVHFVGLFRFHAIEGLLLAPWFRLWGRPYIHTAHNTVPHGSEHRRFDRQTYRWIYRFPHVIIAHTDRVAAELTSVFGVSHRSIEVISIGLNQEVRPTDLSTAAARRALGLPVSGRIALCFGKIEPYKGVDVLIEAWGLVRAADTRLCITGWCPNPTYARSLRALIASSPRQSTIQLREGFVPNDTIAVWLKACDVVVMPYRHIYQSGVVFLCLRFGVPIVATNVGSLADYLDPECGLVASSNDPAGIAQALNTFFAAPTVPDRNAAIDRAKKYQWDRQCVSIAHLYV